MAYYTAAATAAAASHHRQVKPTSPQCQHDGHGISFGINNARLSTQMRPFSIILRHHYAFTHCAWCFAYALECYWRTLEHLRDVPEQKTQFVEYYASVCCSVYVFICLQQFMRVMYSTRALCFGGDLCTFLFAHSHHTIY